MPQLGPLEIAVVLLVALLVFGPNRLPELARQVGGALRELRKIQQTITADLHEMMTDESTGAAAPPTLPPRADPAAGDVTDIVDVVGRDTPGGLPPTDVPTSGSGEDSGPAAAEVPPPPPPPPDPV